MANAQERRCKATSRSGERCRVRITNAAGFCVGHDPEMPADMGELGRRSGEARRRPDPKRVHPSLRAYLRENVAPSEVWAAPKLALEGKNEAARVGASKVLMDALSEDRDTRAAREAVDMPAARAKLDKLIAREVAAAQTRSPDPPPGDRKHPR